MAYSYQDVSSRRTPRFRVFDGTRLLGEVQYRWFRHIRQFAWEATGADQSHRAVHEERWQAEWALAWDGTGYPFPVHPRYRPA
jgi:hypothetical protein